MKQEHAHFNMVEQQIRTWKVLNPTLLNYLRAVPRDCFVPAQYQGLAYSEASIPLTPSRAMIPPTILARMLEALGTTPLDNVLLLGAESGYLAALLAQRANWVRCKESDPALLSMAADNLAAADIKNVILEEGDLLAGWPERAPYDLIVLNGCVKEIPETLIDQLASGGKICGFVGQSPAMKLHVIFKDQNNQLQQQEILESHVPMLESGLQIPTFQF